MPEGDTVYRSARRLHEHLAGARVEAVRAAPAVRAPLAERLVGEVVASVEPRGKHLLAWFSPSGLALHTHLGMTGAWHLYRSGERWRKPERLATVVLEFAGRTAVGFRVPTCELLTARQVTDHPAMAGLGPDALDDDAPVDLGEARARLDRRGTWTIGEALLDQRVLAGIGNVYKNEVLFVHGVHPWTPVADVPPAARDALLATATKLLRANVAPGASRRTTTGAPAAAGGDRLHVYGKARRPCPRCHTPIRAARHGEQARLTYWCPRCQPPADDHAPHPARPRRRVTG